MKKILFVTHTLGGGGAEKILINILHNLSKNHNFDITLLSIVDTGVYKKNIPENVKYKTFIRMPFKKCVKKNKSGSLLVRNNIFTHLAVKVYTLFWRIIPARILHKIIIKDYFDYEVAFLEGICAKVVSGGNSPIKYCWIHVDMLNQHKSKNIFKDIKEERNVYYKYNKIVCVSEYVKKTFIELFDLTNDERIIVKYNPVNQKEIVNKGQVEINLRKRHSKDTFIICSVGRLNKQKKYIRLINIMSKLKMNNINAVCYILGEGTDRKYLEKAIKDYRLEKVVFLPGFVDNPYAYMKQSDLFVCCSIAEGFSTAVSEAVILGTPVVTTNCSGMEEILCDSEYGIITDNTEDALYDGVEKMISDKDVYTYYLKKVQERKDFFDPKSRYDKISELFE